MREIPGVSIKRGVLGITNPRKSAAWRHRTYTAICGDIVALLLKGSELNYLVHWD